MTFPGVPWFVGGGAVNPPEAARLLAQIATRGEGGVLLPGDCEVFESAVPSSVIRVTAGSVVVPNTKSNANGEVYIERNPGDHVVAITPTDASGPRSDLVYYRVADPQYADEPTPADVATGPYSWVEVAAGVSGTCTTVEQAIAEGALPAGRVGIALARVDMPTSTGTVTDAEIVDVRALPSPRSQRRTHIAMPAGGDVLTESGFVLWPDEASWAVQVPEWATHAIVHITATGLSYGTADSDGATRVKLGTVVGQNVNYSVESVAGNGKERTTVHAFDTLAVPTGLRGTTQNVQLQGKRNGASGGLVANATSAVIADVEFQERIG